MVVIKGFVMPKYCQKCKLHESMTGKCKITGKINGWDLDNLPSDCPLEEVGEETVGWHYNPSSEPCPYP